RPAARHKEDAEERKPKRGHCVQSPQPCRRFSRASLFIIAPILSASRCVESLLRVGAYAGSVQVNVEAVREQCRHKRGESSALDWPDRKSTRLNSSHVKISYAVF